VQEEIKLTDDQKAEVHKVQEKQTAAFQKLRDAGDREKAFEGMRAIREETKKDLDKWKEASLKPEQAKRLKQIEWQNSNGIQAFTDAEVQKELKFTDKQKDEIKEIHDGLDKDRRELLSGAQGDRQKMRELQPKVQALQKEAKDKVNGLLTDEQKKTWETMLGEKFEVKNERPQGRQGNGSGNKQS
jgi:hypothetical protein